MANSELFTAAHKLAKTFEGNYQACFVLALLEIRNLKNDNMNEEEIKEYKLYIPYNEKKDQKRAKQYLKVKWNSTGKFWHTQTSMKEIKECNLTKYLKVLKKEEKNGNNLGDYGVGCMTTRAKAQKYGFDAIEN